MLPDGLRTTVHETLQPDECVAIHPVTAASMHDRQLRSTRTGERNGKGQRSHSGSTMALSLSLLAADHAVTAIVPAAEA